MKPTRDIQSLRMFKRDTAQGGPPNEEDGRTRSSNG